MGKIVEVQPLDSVDQVFDIGQLKFRPWTEEMYWESSLGVLP